FRAASVDHVIMFDSQGSLSLFFMNEANSQHYYPRYGGETGSAFQVLMTGNPPVVQPQQLKGAMGFGWIPAFDLPNDQNPDNGPYANNARRTCLKVMADHGITFADNNAEEVGFSYCNNVWLLRAALNLTPSIINAATFVAA